MSPVWTDRAGSPNLRIAYRVVDAEGKVNRRRARSQRICVSHWPGQPQAPAKPCARRRKPIRRLAPGEYACGEPGPQAGGFLK